MSNYHLRDKNLSYKSKGLLSFMLSLPLDWDYSFNGLVVISKEGKAAIRNIINELKEAKYIKINQYRNEKGFFRYYYDVYEIPFNIPLKSRNSPTPDYRATDYRTSDNQPQINTNKQIDKIDKIDKTLLKQSNLVNELIRLGYIKENDEQINLYDSLFEKYLNDGIGRIEIYSSIRYIVPRVISRNFIDEEGETISNKFGYLKTSIESNFRKLSCLNEELYPDDKDSFWENYKDI